MKILLVEDNRADARLFAELLSEVPGRPFQLTTVDTLVAATAAVTDHDVVFLDLSLPDAHGLSTLTSMLTVARQTPIVVLTGNSDDRVAVDAVKAGAQDYVIKSEITPQLIAKTARYAIERKLAEANTKRLASSDEAIQRARFSSSITAAITASLELDETLGEVAKLWVPTLADYCVIDLVREGGRIERVAFAAAQPEREAELRQLGAYVPGVTHPKSPVLAAIERRTSILIDAFDPLSLAPDPAYLALCQVLDARSMLVTPLVARDRVVGAITSVMGPSGRGYEDDALRLAEEVGERVALGIDNASLYASAQRAIRGRDELIAVVSHDLRNPLNIVTLALQMVDRDPDTLRAALPRAMRGVDRMQRLIDDLLDVARIDNGTLNVELTPVDLGSILEDAFEQHKLLAADKRIQLVRAFDGQISAVADRHRLGQALANLVGNSLKFTPPGGSIRIGAEGDGGRVSVWVADTGPGIAPEHLDHIFDRFWQPEQRRDGIGLGLAIVKGIVDAHGGSIEVDSQLGAGTTFRIVLPGGSAGRTVAIH
ncbi:MAG: response regulator [Deltaproteobacteria bacterium]|nr:response regulator [Deltaproteobacteria bacterium]